MNVRLVSIWTPGMIGGMILVAGLTSGVTLLSWTGVILMAAAFVPLGLIRLPIVRRRWLADAESRFRSMRFLLFTGPFFGLPVVLMGILLKQPIWIVVGGGIGLVSVFSAIHVALATDSR